MKPPALITAPVDLIVTAADMREHLRITGTDEDGLLTGYIAAATAYMDGWKGVLGRAVMSQTWREEFDGFGVWRLSLPDVVSATVTATDSAGAAVTVTQQTLKQDFQGFYVDTAGGAAETVAVQYVAAMPSAQVAAAQMVVKLLVANWYENRAATSDVNLTEVPMAAQMLIESMRWSRM